MSNDFLSKWLGKGGRKQVDWRKLSRRTIKSDKWDEEDLAQIMRAMPDFERARDLLCDTVDTGNGATADTFFSFFKGEPRNHGAEEIRPDYLINAFVRDELQELVEWEELRALGTIGDDVNSALAFITVKDDLETLFDKVKKEQELAEQISQQIQELRQLEAEAAAIDSMIDEAESEEGEGEGEGEGSGAGDAQEGQAGDGDGGTSGRDGALKDLQGQKKANGKARGKLEAKLGTNAEKLREALDKQRPHVQKALRDALKKAIDEQETMSGMTDAFGTEPGQMQRLSATERLELAKRIKNSTVLVELLKLVGPMKRIMFGEQRKQANHARDEVFNVEKGDDLSRLLPETMAHLHHPALRRNFYRDMVEQSLLQFELRGTERQGLGGIICCIDNSGSMAGAREVYAKAIGLSTLHLAREQKRSFLGIHFGSAREIKEFPFLEPSDYSMEKILEFAELFFNGGTDFQSPLTTAVKHLREEFAKYGKVHGDILFITDGFCTVSDDWFDDFKKEQAELDFQVFGIVVGQDSSWYRADDTLDRICDGKVIKVKDLTSPDDIRAVFAEIHSF